jgi:hypothetical protein
MDGVRLAIALLLAAAGPPLCGCAGDGRYRVQGRVLVEREGQPAPVEGATVALRERGARKPPRRTALTGAEGTYEVVWERGGALPLASFGQPVLTVEADGYLPVEQQVCGRQEAPGVVRADCDPRRQCCARIIVVLTPAAAPPAAGPPTGG